MRFSGTGNAFVYDSQSCLTTLSRVSLPSNGRRTVWLRPVFPDMPYASLVATTVNAGNPETTIPASTGLTFSFIP